ncbi:adhesive plaque matrix protein-like [Cimex lectularius]|uniref:CPR type cuticle protein n=1 Tax=Cimex lectularius TaxID=79782 RepID=A0A8I6SD68_CIMLE|nr:adhesive plaque matrix protein-like [Cimex lectularius]
MHPHGLLTGFVCLGLFLFVSAEEEQQEVPIIKQINRVNEDGTYTFGYEAADGSFKIETRDVLGNVKGMFGFIDQTGELKRVSYSASNGTGFQATNYGRERESSTRKPVLVYRGNNHAGQVLRRGETTTPTYDYTRTTERPIRVLVTKRPLEKSPNLIRRQLDRSRDNQDIYTPGSNVPRNFRYPQIIGPDPREVYRNMLLEQSNLKPDYPRVRYYTPVEEDYPEVPAVVPMVDRVLSSRRYRPSVVDEQVYPVPRRPAPPAYRQQYDYPPIDYEALREEIMNYLIQYLQYRTRRPVQAPYYQQPRYDDYYQPPPAPLPRIPYYRPPVQQPPLPYPYVNTNVQYSQPEQVSQQQDQIALLKERMDSHDHRDTADTRPPSPGLIKMLLARPSTVRPSVRSVEILGTAASTRSTPTTRSAPTSTQSTEPMVAAS